MHGIEPTLETLDLGGTIAFYRDLLGFRVALLWPEPAPTFCILERDRVRLMFFVSDRDDGSRPSMNGQLRIDMEGVAPLYEKIRDDVETEWGPEVYSYGRREVSILDCNGYSLILSEPTSDAITCDVDEA